MHSYHLRQNDFLWLYDAHIEKRTHYNEMHCHIVYYSQNNASLLTATLTLMNVHTTVPQGSFYKIETCLDAACDTITQ